MNDTTRKTQKTTQRRRFLKTTAVASTGTLAFAALGSTVPVNAASAAAALAETKRKVRGTETEKNLLKAFAGESQARNRYTFFAEQAREEGYEQIAAIFEETAGHERMHAKRFFSYLEGGSLEIQAAFPAGIIGDTEVNLAEAAAGEHEEWAILYPAFGKVAVEEGFPDIGKLFQNVCVAEQMHERRYLDFLKNVREDLVFTRNEKTTWMCRNCGFLAADREAPGFCPACAFPQSYFQLFVPNW